MTSLESRLRTLEKRIETMGSHPLDAVVKAAIIGDTFTGWHIDRLFDRIHEPFRAAIIVAANAIAGTPGLTGTVERALGDFAMYVAGPHVAFGNRADPDRILAECQQVLSVPETLRDPQWAPEYDIRRRVHCGLAQRLMASDGLDELRELLRFYREHPVEEWPLPLMTDKESARLLDLVSPLETDRDVLVVIWRNEDGAPRQTYMR